MVKRFLLLVAAVIAMAGALNAQDQKETATRGALCSEGVSLEALTNYMDTTHNADVGIKMFYRNLVNNPTHSYRIEHLDLGFNGCTGRVDEQVVMANGTKRDNVFIFNNQGLLTRSVIQGSKGKTEVNYTYSYDEVLGFSIKQSKSKNRTTDYFPIYGEHGRRECIKASNGQRQDYTYNEQGHLAKLVITPAKGDKRTLLYQDGYVVREETGGKAYRYFYDFDTATGKKFLIAIKELKGTDVVHERTFDYDIDTHGRYTRVRVALDGKHQMTITRSYMP